MKNFSDFTGEHVRTPQYLPSLSGERHIGPCLPVVLGGLGDGEKHNNGDTVSVNT
jgi:hypothetical protein